MSEEPTLQQKDAKRGDIDSLSALAPAPIVRNSADADRRLLVFRKIAAPLMAVVAGAPADENGPATTSQNAEQFAALIDATIALNHQISDMLDIGKDDSAARWEAAAAAGQIVASHYRATNHTLTAEESKAIVDTLRRAGTQSLDAPDAEPEEEESGIGRNLRALAPIISAIARFSFTRDPMELLAEVTTRLQQMAAEVTAKLGGGMATTDSPLYLAVLEVAAEFYMESHFAEMNRLLEMPPEERKEYVQAHGRKIPLEPVWERLGLKMSMLEALTAYLPEATR